MTADSTMAARIAELRRAFDESFAAPRAQPGEESVALLAIRVVRDRYALRLGELSGLQLRRKVVPLPGVGVPTIGIAGFRGKVVPVYSLAGLLGYGARGDEPWLALAGDGDAPVALAFAAFEGHHRLARSAIRTAESTDLRDHAGEVVTLAGGACPVISVPSILQVVDRATGASSNHTRQPSSPGSTP